MDNDDKINGILEKVGRKERLSAREKHYLKTWSEKNLKPEEGTDFIKQKIVDYTVSLDVNVRKKFEEGEDPDENDIVLEAIQLIRKGCGDPDGDVVHEDLIKKLVVDKSGKPFDEDKWRDEKLKKYLPKKRWETRPIHEAKLERFGVVLV